MGRSLEHGGHGKNPWTRKHTEGHGKRLSVDFRVPPCVSVSKGFFRVLRVPISATDYDLPMEPILIADPSLQEVLDELIRREPIFHHPEFGTTRADFANMTVPD